MKWFYVTAAVLIGGLTASPMLFLKGRDPNEYADLREALGRELIIRFDSYGSAVKSIDPASCGDVTSSSFQANLWEGPYAYHYLIRPPKVVPLLAAEMPKITDGGLTYTIKLKGGVKYHRNPCFGRDPDDPTKWATRNVQAKDFVVAFKRIADYHVYADLSWTFLSERVVGVDEFRKKTEKYKIGDFSRYDLPVEGLKALDELTFQIRLIEPYPQLEYVLAMHVYAPIPREAMEYWFGTEDDGKGGRRPIPVDKERSTQFREAEQIVGTGPYILKTFERKHKIVLVRNPDFRDDRYPSVPDEADLTEAEKESVRADVAAGLYDDAGRKVPFIDVLEFDFVSEDYSAWMRFLSKQTDAAGIPRETFEFVITPGKDLTETWSTRGMYLRKYSSPVIYWIVFNMEDPVIGGSKSLRQALCLAFDVENYIKVLRNDRGKRPVNVIPSSFKSHKVAGPGPYCKLDLEAAKKKIVQAKKELAEAGLLKGGQIPELRFEMAVRDPRDEIQADFIKQQFAKVDVRLKIIANDWPTLQRKVRNKKAQIYTMGWHADYPDAENFLQLFYSPNIAKYTNNANYSDPRFDEMYRRARKMPDTPERTKLYAEMAGILSEDCPVLLLNEPEGYVLYYAWTSNKNIKRHPVGYGFTKYRRLDPVMRKKLGGR